MRDVVVIVVAAGSGERFGHRLPKALVPLAGRPLVGHAVAGAAAAGVERFVVVGPEGHLDAVRSAVTDAAGSAEVVVAAGGATRGASVRAGCEAAARFAPQVVAIHDAARCLTPPEVHRRVVGALGGDVVAAAPGLPVPDTLKRVDEDGTVQGTVDRLGTWAVHTPQAFAATTLATVQAWARGRDATDDLGLFEEALAAGVVSGRARLVEGSLLDLKVTWPRDLAVAEALLGGAAERGAR